MNEKYPFLQESQVSAFVHFPQSVVQAVHLVSDSFQYPSLHVEHLVASVEQVKQFATEQVLQALGVAALSKKWFELMQESQTSAAVHLQFAGQALQVSPSL